MVGPISLEALVLLDGLCSFHNRNMKVKVLNKPSLRLCLDELHEAQLVYHGTFEPTPWTMADWRKRQFEDLERHEAGGCAPPVYTRKSVSETPARLHAEPTDPPAPRAVDDGGGAARLDAPSPKSNQWGEISETTPAQLLVEVEDYCAAAGVSKSRFGKMAANDFGFIKRLRCGKSVSQATVDKVRAVIAGPVFKVKRGGRPHKDNAKPVVLAVETERPSSPPARSVDLEVNAHADEHDAAFAEQLKRVERGEVRIRQHMTFRPASPDVTLGGVTGEINL